jgi:hypothetical protein
MPLVTILVLSLSLRKKKSLYFIIYYMYYLHYHSINIVSYVMLKAILHVVTVDLDMNRVSDNFQ